MAKNLILVGFGILVGTLVTLLTGACRADDRVEPNAEVQALADETGLDAISLLGALNAQPGVDVRGYLMFLGRLNSPAGVVGVESSAVPPAAGLSARVRLTYYVEGGRTYGGGQTFAGSTACSWNWALGTRFVFPNGETFVCNDRGLLGSSGWLDLWRRRDLVDRYGPYVTVKVIP